MKKEITIALPIEIYEIYEKAAKHCDEGITTAELIEDTVVHYYYKDKENREWLLQAARQ